MINLNQKLPPRDPGREAAALHEQRMYQQWRSDPGTCKFFRALEQRRMALLTSAGKNSTRTGMENAKEHNQLVEANAILTIIETYGRADKYPYHDLDADEERTIARALGN